MANISLKFTNRNGRFCLCATVVGTTTRHYRTVDELKNPDFKTWNKAAQRFTSRRPIDRAIEDYCVSKGIVNIPSMEQGAIIKISAHDWPGNYRELKSCIENAVICCEDGKIRGSDLNITKTNNGEELPQDEKGQLIYFLTKFNGRKVRVMEAMGITAPTLDRKLKIYGIDYKLFKPTKKKKTSTTASK